MGHTTYQKWEEHIRRELRTRALEPLRQEHKIKNDNKGKARMDGLLFICDLSDYIGQSESTIRRRIKDGNIPYHRLGGSSGRFYFLKDEIDEWISNS